MCAVHVYLYTKTAKVVVDDVPMLHSYVAGFVDDYQGV